MSPKDAPRIGKKKFSMPNALVLLIILILISYIATFIVPSGTFEREYDDLTGRELVLPGTFTEVDSEPVGFFDLLACIPEGIVGSADIIALVLIVGGVFGIINDTGAINALLGKVIKNMSAKRAYIIIAGIMFVGSLMGYAYGAAELMLPFIPIAVAACIAMGYDSMTGCAIILLGAGAGFAGTSINPSTAMIAQNIAGLPVGSGMWFRNIAYAAFLITAILYIFRYMRKIKKNPQLSPMHETDKTSEYDINSSEIPELTGRRKAIVAVFAIGLVAMVVCIVQLGLVVNQITGFYLIIGLICGIIDGQGAEKMTNNFISGAKDMIFSALVIGVARAISVIMTDGMILDTITNYAANLVSALPNAVKAVGMFVFQAFLSIVVPSGSGQATVTMPIMAPLADLVGMTRQTAVLAYQYGDATINLITPTSGYFMAAIAMCRIKWGQWFKWFLPLWLIWVLIACTFLVIATQIHLGPF